MKLEGELIIRHLYSLYVVYRAKQNKELIGAKLARKIGKPARPANDKSTKKFIICIHENSQQPEFSLDIEPTKSCNKVAAPCLP
jgi:hypothetical protein